MRIRPKRHCVLPALTLVIAAYSVFAIAQEASPISKRPSRWDFPVNTYASWKRTVAIESEESRISKWKEVRDRDGLRQLPSTATSESFAIIKGIGSSYFPDLKSAVGGSEVDLEIDGKKIKCTMIIFEDRVKPRTSVTTELREKFPDLFPPKKGEQATPKADPVRPEDAPRIRFSMSFCGKDAPFRIPFRELQLKEARNLAMPSQLVQVKLDVFKSDEAENPIASMSRAVTSTKVPKTVGTTELECVREVGEGTRVVGTKTIRLSSERLLSDRVLGHVVFNREESTDGTKSVVMTEEVVEFDTGRIE